MAAGKKLEGAGLRGQIAGQTSLCTVGTSAAGLTLTATGGEADRLLSSIPRLEPPSYPSCC